ncbi:hypothetical protein [Hamadaea tsunoensis]|uniref:hypothetical protein n=1 Tax=Hamadaea tsunoensis TaxID=53368 RepID=UPI00041F212B|nr:hypothetical protein [Hamadaea tsunoensis]
MTVRVVLDTSALLAYSRMEGLAVGELVNSVAEDPGSIVGIPAASYLAAHAQLSGDERGLLVRLVTAIDGVTAILPLLGTDTVEVADLDARSAKHAGLGHAIVETRKHGAALATYLGQQARGDLDEDDVLDLV